MSGQGFNDKELAGIKPAECVTVRQERDRLPLKDAAPGAVNHMNTHSPLS